MHSKSLVWLVSLEQTPDYLDPQSQEALHEVDVSGMALHFPFGAAPQGEAIGSLGGKELVRIGRRQNKEPAMIRIKRVYSEPSARDGVRILVDRVWPRGISKERARIVEWRKDLAPTTSLRKWFGHEPARWVEFRRRYRIELKRSSQLDALDTVAQRSSRKTITLVYSAADEQHNQAVVLMELLEELLSKRRS